MTTGKQLGSEPALPFAQVTEAFTTAYNQHRGTSKRELAAMFALQGLLTNGMPPTEYLAEQAVKAADMLCDELAKGLAAVSLRERLAMAACYALVFLVLPALLFFPPAFWRVL